MTNTHTAFTCPKSTGETLEDYTMPIMPKADNKVTSTMPITSFWCLYCTTGNIRRTLLQCLHCQP